jgi:hypothetical protein
MSAYTCRMLLLQGYSRDDVIHNPNLNPSAPIAPTNTQDCKIEA